MWYLHECHAKKLAVDSIQKDNKYVASSINFISNTILKYKGQSKWFSLKPDIQIEKHATLIIKTNILNMKSQSKMRSQIKKIREKSLAKIVCFQEKKYY
jgi:hypothetical protein